MNTGGIGEKVTEDWGMTRPTATKKLTAKKPKATAKRKPTWAIIIEQNNRIEKLVRDIGVDARAARNQAECTEFNLGARIDAKRLPSITEDGSGGFIAKLSDGSTVVHRSPFERTPEPPKPAEPYKPKAGEVVVVTSAQYRSVPIETVATVVASPLYVDDPDVWIVHNGQKFCYAPKDLRPATEAEIAAHEAALKAKEQEAELAKPLKVCHTRVKYAGHEGVYLGPYGTQYEIGRPNGSGGWTISVCNRSEFTVIE